MKTRFIHTADWQIGKSFDRITDAAKRENLRRARLDSLAGIGTIAEEKGVDFILVAGDLFDSPTTDKSTLAAGLSAIGKLRKPVIAIPGNHDHGGQEGFWHSESFQRQHAEFAPNLTLLLEPEPYDTGLAWVLPCPLLRRSESTDPAAWVRTADLQAVIDSGKPVILLAHGSTQTFGTGGYDDEEGDQGASNLIRLDLLPQGLVDYAALGDWHGTKEIQPWAFYSGTHEPDRFTKGGDHDPGNVLLVDAVRGAPPVVEKIRTATIGWHSLQFEFSDSASLDVFRGKLAALTGMRVDTDLLQLDLAGFLGLGDRAALDQTLDDLRAKLVRLKLRDAVRIAPTAQEVDSLATRSDDPLIAGVARKLLEKTTEPGGEADIAAAALQELFAAVQTHQPPQKR